MDVKKINWWIGGGVTYSSAYQTLLNKASTDKKTAPSAAVKTLQDAFISTLNTKGILAKLDVLQVMLGDGSYDFSAYNWVNPAVFKQTRATAPFFNINDGMFGNSVSSYMDTGFSPSAATKLTQNSGELIFFFKASAASSSAQHGIGSTPATYLVPFYDATHFNFTINGNANGFLTGNDTAEGLYQVSRIDSANIGIKKNNGARQTVAKVSTGLNTENILIDALINTGVVSNYNSQVCYLFAAGQLLTTQDETDFYNAWTTYMNAVRAISLPTTVGSIYNVSSYSNLNDFTVHGATASVVSNKIRFSGGANTFTQTLDLSSISGVNIGNSLAMKWTTAITFTVPTLTATSFGIGVGVKSYNNGGTIEDLVLKINTSTTSTGVMTLCQGITHIVVDTSPALTISAGDVVTLSMTRNIDTITYFATNVTTITTAATRSVIMFTDANNQHQPNTHKFAMYNFSTDNLDVSAYSVAINEYYQPDLLILGDSKTAGYRATAQTLGGAFLIKNARSPKTVVFGGPSDASADFVSVMYMITNYIKPRYLMLCGLSNDIRQGVSAATWKANLASIVSQCVSAGIIPILCTGFYETSLSQAAVQTEMNTNYSSYTIIDIVDTVITLNADGIHPDTAGHQTWATAALATNKIPL